MGGHSKFEPMVRTSTHGPLCEKGGLQGWSELFGMFNANAEHPHRFRDLLRSSGS